MSPDDVKWTLDILSKLSIISGLVLILIGGAKRLWVWGYQLRDAEDRHEKDVARYQAEIRDLKEFFARNEQVSERLLRLYERQQDSTPSPPKRSHKS